MVSGDKNVHELSHSSVHWLICVFIKTNIFIFEGAQGWRPVFCALHLLASAGGTRCRLHELLICGARKELMWNMKCYVILGGGLDLLPIEDQKTKKKTSAYLFYSLSLAPPLSICVRPSHPLLLSINPPPPPTLTLACLSGLLPCIPPFPVWPLSQEVAQLVDKHHGNGEEGLGSPRPLRLCQ